MKFTRNHTKIHSTMVPLKLLRLVVSQVLSLFFLLPLGLHFLFSSPYGFMVNFSLLQRKLRMLQRWKSELGLLMPHWMNGFRELLTLSQLPNQRKRSRWGSVSEVRLLQHMLGIWKISK